MAVSITETPMCDGPRSTLSPDQNVTPFPVSADFTRLLRLDKNKTTETELWSSCFAANVWVKLELKMQDKVIKNDVYLGSLGIEGIKDPVRL